MMTEKRTPNHLFGSVIKDLMNSCDIPKPQEVPLLVRSHVTMKPPFLGRNLGERIYRQDSLLVFNLTSHCVTNEVMTSGRYFSAGRALRVVIMLYCFIVLCDDVLLCDFNLCASGFLPIQTLTVTQWKWLLFLFCSSPQFSAGRWVITFVKQRFTPASLKNLKTR